MEDSVSPFAAPASSRDEEVARAAEEAASAASLLRLASEVSLEAHGYVPLRRLGGSTTATVMVVHRLGLPERQFVVKAIALRGLDAQGRLRALKEIQILKSLRHESIIEYIESWWIGAGPDSGRLTLVMECAENGDLRVPVQAAGQSGKHLEEVLVLSWLQQMLRGLDHVHQKEIIHRDLKAMNVFLKDTWRTCKLGDFGISTALESGKSASGCVGTPAYMAPELLWNQRYASAVDMWAIGVVLYELMALKLPFCGSNVLALVYQIAFNTYDPEPLCMVGYSTALIELVSRLLDKDPTKRPSASQLLGEPALWETFSIEAAGTMAAASFNASLSSNLFSDTCQGDLSEVHDACTPGITMPSAMQMASGTGSDWGDAVALLASVRTDGSVDSITGERIAGSDVEARAAASLGSYVTPEQLWDGLHRTRHESDTVERGQLDDLLDELRDMLPFPSPSTPPPPPPQDCAGDLPCHDISPSLCEKGDPADPGAASTPDPVEDSFKLAARVDLFLKRRGQQANAST